LIHDVVALSAIRVMAFMLSDVLHEAVGHGLNALLTGAQTEVKTGFMPEARESRSVIQDSLERVCGVPQTFGVGGRWAARNRKGQRCFGAPARCH
jgi:hypothetical protein